MAYQTQVSTSTLTNQNINTALLVHTFTNVTRLREVWLNVYVTDIVGNGDYTAYVTQQRAGAGVWYESVKTTKPVGVGITSIMFNSIPLTVNATDVVRVYLLGLAGDNVGAVDIITEVNEEWVDIDANGRVDVGEWLGVAPAALSASGYLQAMVLRWLTDNAAGTPNALSTGDLPADVKQWLATAPAALTASGYLQVALLRWLTDNAAGTPLALSSNLVQAYSSVLSGITSLANWLRLMARKDAALAADAVAAQAEINANLGSGAGAHTNTTDSEEAIRDQLAPGAAVTLNAEETVVHVSP